MNTARNWRLAAVAALAAGLLGPAVIGVPAASAQAAPPTLAGEQLTGPQPGTIGISCSSNSGTGSFSFTTSGTATGPYPGTFTETGSGTVNPAARLASYTATFTIDSAAGEVTGTDTLNSSGINSTCFTGPGDFYTLPASSSYQATIQTAQGNYADEGTSRTSLIEQGGTVQLFGETLQSSETQTVAGLAVATTSLPGATVGSSYSAPLTATGGTPPYTWSIASGSLPAGLSLNASTGVISGTPTAAATSSFTVQATDSTSPTPLTATQPLSITVSPAAVKADLKVALSVPARAADGASVTETVTVTNQGPATASKVGTALTEAGGLTVTNAGGAKVTGPVLTWTTASLAPGASETFTVTVQVAAHAHGTVLIAAGALSATPDPNLLNNAAAAKIALG
jgi:hypothetical protein